MGLVHKSHLHNVEHSAQEVAKTVWKLEGWDTLEQGQSRGDCQDICLEHWRRGWDRCCNRLVLTAGCLHFVVKANHSCF